MYVRQFRLLIHDVYIVMQMKKLTTKRTTWLAKKNRKHCHAIWQLYKKIEGVFASIEFQNWWSSFVIGDHLKALSPVATDDMDGNGLKL